MYQVQELRPPAALRGRRSLPISAIVPRMLEACASASLNMGGPSLKSVGVSSSVRGEGRSSIAIAMAMIQAREYGRRVLLLEMDDFDHACLAHRFGADPQPGISELVQGKASIEQIVQPITNRLSLIAAGEVSDGGSRVLLGAVQAGLILELVEHCDVLIADLPPVLEGSFTRLVLGEFERVLLVVRAAVTPMAQVRQALDCLPAEPAILLNATYTRMPRWIQRIRGS